MSSYNSNVEYATINITCILYIAMNKPPSLSHTCHETLPFVRENHFLLWLEVMFMFSCFLKFDKPRLSPFTKVGNAKGFYWFK
jgi:hypothetical protein